MFVPRRIWVIKTGEPIPYLPAEAGDRLFRVGLMAEALLEAGHEVTWWSTQFHHQLKIQRDVPLNTPFRPTSDAPQMIFLPSCGYRRHISPSRFWDHAQVRRGFERIAPHQPRPGLILCAWPTIDLAFAATRFGQAHGIPVVLDIRDLWPDILYERIRAKTGLPFGGYLRPYERMGRAAMRDADSVISITKGMLDWAQTRFSRAPRPEDRVFHQCQSAQAPTPNVVYWRAKGVDLEAPKTRFVWAGSLVSDLDVQTLLSAIEALSPEVAETLDFVFCGTGDLVPRIEDMAKRLSYVTYGGWVSKEALAALYDASHIGLMCYLERFDFQVSIPNKVVDFTRNGLRILTNLEGELARVLDPVGLRISYPTGDVNALRARLEEIESKPQLYRAPAPSARALFDKLFDASAVMPEFVRHMEHIAKKGEA